jgi:transcriptional regulator with XRE-family HTH domain
MAEPTTLGSWLRRERERRGVTLAKISEDTKVAVPLLQGLEADDLSRWPGGIFRRSFVRSYAAAIGLDPELVVRRVEEEHPSDPPEPATGAVDPRGGRPSLPKSVEAANTGPVAKTAPGDVMHRSAAVRPPMSARATRVQSALLDLLVAGAIGFGFAAAGSRLLWPVLAIAAYHLLGVLLTGTTPMMALLTQPQEQPAAEPPQPIAAPAPAPAAEPAPVRRVENEPRHVRRARARRAARSDQPATHR